MGNFKFDNGKSDAVNLAGMLNQIVKGFHKTVSLVAESKNRPTPQHIKIDMVIVLGMAFGIGTSCSMNTETIIKGVKQYLSKTDDVDGLFNHMMSAYSNPRYKHWFEYGGGAACAFMERDNAEATMLDLATKYFDARD